MTIYVDIIFLENIFMNCIILLATGIIVKTKVSVIRNILASCIGSVYAIVLYVSNMAIYSNVFLKIVLSLVIVYIAFTPNGVKSFLKHLIIFYLTSFTFGGVAFALLYFVRPQDILVQKGVLIGTYPIKMILIGGILGFIIITISFKNIKGKLTKKDMYCKVFVESEGNKVEVDGIIDTGNFLKDPITKMPVIVVERGKLNEVIPKKILDNIGNIVNGKDVDLGEYSSKIRVIPFKSLGKDNGLLLGIRVNKVQIEYQDIMHVIENVIIGIYNGILSKNGKYFSLVGLDIIR